MVDPVGRADGRWEVLASSGSDDAVVGLPDRHPGKRVHGIAACRDPRQALREAEVMEYAPGWLLADRVPKSVELVNALPRSDVLGLRSSAMVAERTGGR